MKMMQLESFPRATLLTVCAAISLTACGGGDGGGVAAPPPMYTAQIQSNPNYDGDIADTLPVPTITQGMTLSPPVQSVLAGIDFATGVEYRAFLNFPLGGAGGVPGNAIIDSAFLDIHVDSLTPGGTLPIIIELVSFQPPGLIDTDFDRALQPPLATVIVSPPITTADVGANISIDVTPLMVEAQNRGLVDFQVRILEDLGPPIDILMEIDDTTVLADRPTFAPLLTVTYF
jgi:hypothetical protein